MQIAGTLFWVTPEAAGRREVVEAAAADFDLPVHFCAYSTLFSLLRSELCELIGIEVGDNAEQALALVLVLLQ